MRFERIVILLAALAASAGTARLGLWQLDRAAQKNALQSALDTRRALPPITQEALARDEATATAQHHRNVTLHGQWMKASTLFLENRQMNGRVGFYVLTPLALDDGTAVVVQRGWLPRDANERMRVTAPSLPAGEVQLVARIAPTPARLYELGAAASGVIRQNLDLASYAQEIGRPLRPLSVLQLSATGGIEDGVQRDWPQAASDVHKHYGYAFQWFALAALIVALYVWFQLISPSRASRRAKT